MHLTRISSLSVLSTLPGCPVFFFSNYLENDSINLEEALEGIP